MPRRDAITDNEAWLEGLSGHVATSRHGDRITARAIREGLDPVCTAARIEYYADERIGYADLRLRRDPVVGLFVMVDFLQVRSAMRGFGIGGSIVTSWVEGLRALGIAELRFDAMRTGIGPGGRTFWAREGVLFLPDSPEIEDLEVRALHALRQRIDGGELSTPADLYRHPLGRQVLGAADWSGRWPLDGRAASHAPAVV